jgi:hypothetical protein
MGLLCYGYVMLCYVMLCYVVLCYVLVILVFLVSIALSLSLKLISVSSQRTKLPIPMNNPKEAPLWIIILPTVGKNPFPPCPRL